MSLEEKIAADFKEAMKARDAARTQALSFLRSQIQYAAIDKRGEKMQDGDVLTVIKKLIKQRRDGLAQFEKGGRMDLVEKEKSELALLEGYLPAALPEAEVARILDEVVAATGAASMKDMGRVMKEVMARTGGAVDAASLSALVKKRLTPCA
ncbi:MAG: GatB/YqeY domain-containing protein [Deltaproteobacteria bacterium]